MTTFVFIVDLFDQELFSRIFLRFKNKNGIQFKQNKIPSNKTYIEYGEEYKYYGMKYTLVFEEGYKYTQQKIDEIKSTLKKIYYEIEEISENTYKMVPNKAIEDTLKTNFRIVEARLRRNQNLEATRRREEERQLQQNRKKKPRWEEPPKRRWKETGRQTSRKRMKPKRLYNVMTLKF